MLGITEIVAEPITQYIFLVAPVVVGRAHEPTLIADVAEFVFAFADDATALVSEAKLEENARWIDVPSDTHLIELRTAPWLEIAGQINVGHLDLGLHAYGHVVLTPLRT